MRLKELAEAQKVGALNVKYDSINNVVTMGGQVVSPADLAKFLSVMGWTRYEQKPHEIFDKTSKFVTNFKKYFKKTPLLEGANFEFQNFRRQNTLSYYERILITFGGRSCTVMVHYPGLKGTYAVFDQGNHAQPDFSCRTYKELCEYILEYYGFDFEEDE